MIKFLKLFGAKPTKKDITRYEKSNNWAKDKFENLEETSLIISFWDIPELLYKQFANTKQREPKVSLKIIPLDKDSFLANNPKAKMIWYGHSVLLMRINSKTILVDPMLGKDASPIAPVATKRFSPNTLDLIDDFPEIDLLLLSHDHYDHLDYDSIKKLISKTKKYYVALGVKRHLVKWGVDEHLIEEFDWWDEATFANIKITFTPTRHFSGRGLNDRALSLWGGWVFKTNNENIWFSGDGGFGSHFKAIGEKLGPFDFAFMECGQYNVKWEAIHLFPKMSVQAAVDANVRKAMPVHWGGFSLSHHSWTEPAEEFTKATEDQNIELSLPRLGEMFTVDLDLSKNRWWEELI